MITLRSLPALCLGALITLAGSLAHADTLSADQIREGLSHADDYGFTHYIELEAEDRDELEVKGWLDDEWVGDVTFSADGTPRKEERSRRDGGAWGMTHDQATATLATAEAQGMTRFEEIKIDRRGRIEVEGKDREGRDLELYIEADTGEVTRVDRD